MKASLLIGIVSFGLVAGTAGAADIADPAKTQANWKTHCYSCHGNDGRGKTKAGRKAKVKDLTDAKIQKQYSDQQMYDQIKSGMKDKKGKDMMKPYGDKLNDAEIKDLIAFVRTLAK